MDNSSRDYRFPTWFVFLACVGSAWLVVKLPYSAWIRFVILMIIATFFDLLERRIIKKRRSAGPDQLHLS